MHPGAATSDSQTETISMETGGWSSVGLTTVVEQILQKDERINEDKGARIAIKESTIQREK